MSEWAEVQHGREEEHHVEEEAGGRGRRSRGRDDRKGKKKNVMQEGEVDRGSAEEIQMTLKNEEETRGTR